MPFFPDILRPPNVVLFSYIRGLFVYCPFLLEQFKTQLAEMVGISSNYLSLIERGNKGQSYSMETLFKIAEALDVNANDLLEGI